MEKRVCLITGCSRGIGRAMVDVFAKAGMVVYANARKESCLDDISRELNIETEGVVIPVYFDVTDEESCKKCVLQIKKEYGKIDVLVNNAGIMKDAYLGMIDEQIMREIFETNVFSVIRLTQYVSRLMKKAGQGAIINLSSIVGVEGNSGQTVYSASKGAVATLTKTWAKELAEYGIRVNAIAPGKIDTDMFHSIGEDRVADSISEIGFGRLGTPEEVANVALMLASDECSYVTGQIIGVNGGLFI